MSEALATYLHDHLAGANFAIELLNTLRDRHAGDPLADFAAGLVAEVEEDRQTLQGIISKTGGEAPVLKEAAGWLAEKVSRFKLRATAMDEFGTFEALETLALGILGKRALWRVLLTIAESDSRVRGPNYEELMSRAESQHNRVDERRLLTARTALATAPNSQA